MFLTVSPNTTGNVFLTDFTFSLTGINIASQIWDFGDGTNSYESPFTSHVYNYPGTYIVSVSSWDASNNAPTIYSTSITASYLYSSNIEFTNIPTKFSDPGEKTSTPFVVSLTSTEIKKPLNLVLQALNSNSTPIQYVPNKWSRIVPTWKFINADTNEIILDPVTINTTPIYYGSSIVAVSGQVSFYYVDNSSTVYDTSSSAPVLLVASLSTNDFVYPPDSQIYPYDSYSNNKTAKVAIVWQVNDYFPTNLKVTENFISGMYPIKWTGVPIPTMVTVEFNSNLNSKFVNYPTVSATLLGYPRTNSIGKYAPLNLSLVGYQEDSPANYSVPDDPLYFQATDLSNNIDSGYVYTYIVPLSGSNTTINVVASTSCIEPLVSATTDLFQFPNGYPIQASAYICRPYNGVINKTTVVNYPNTDIHINQVKELGVLTDGFLSTFSMLSLTSREVSAVQLSSAATSYGTAYNPFLNRLYVSDPRRGTINAYDGDGNIITTVNLSNLSAVLGLSAFPSSISINKDNNVWVSLNNKEILVSFDSDLNNVRSTDSISDLSAISFLSPPVIETDVSGNVWTTYRDVEASRLVQYDKNRGLIQSFVGPVSCIPVSIVSDNTGSIFVANYNSNTINFYDAANNFTLSAISGDFTRPNFLALDRSKNLWFTHGYNCCSKMDTDTFQLSTWQIFTDAGVSYQQNESSPISAIPTNNEMWGGLAVDVYDRVWLIDSKLNNAAIFNVEDPSVLRIVKLRPTNNIVAVSLSATNGIDIPTSHIHASQSSGDWTGNRWYQKYSSPIITTSISGVSDPFTLSDLEGTYNIVKVNEEKNISKYFQSLALPESLSQNPLFFEQFLAAVVGDGDPTKESMGRVTYERIANFLQTHGDFETAEIDQLLSYANQLSVLSKSYGTNFPVEVNRLLNLFSIPKHLLRGDISYETEIDKNIGRQLQAEDIINDGQYLFARDIQVDQYQLIYVTALSGMTSYHLSGLTVDGFKTPLLDNYYIFEYDSAQTGYTNNIINWDSIYNTFGYTLSSNEEWYGDNGLVETMFNNILTKSLYKTKI
jgi:streptogramin lyase